MPPRIVGDVLELDSGVQVLPAGIGPVIRRQMLDPRADVSFGDSSWRGTRSVQVRVELSSDDESERQVNVPVAEWTGARKRRRLTFEYAAPGRRLIEARRLLAPSHPLGAPNAGVYLVTRFTDVADQRRVRSANAAGPVGGCTSCHALDPPTHTCSVSRGWFPATRQGEAIDVTSLTTIRGRRR